MQTSVAASSASEDSDSVGHSSMALDHAEEADLVDLMAEMFGQVAVAVEGEARGNVASVVAARRRERETSRADQESTALRVTMGDDLSIHKDSSDSSSVGGPVARPVFQEGGNDGGTLPEGKSVVVSGVRGLRTLRDNGMETGSAAKAK